MFIFTFLKFYLKKKKTLKSKIIFCFKILRKRKDNGFVLMSIHFCIF